MKKFLGFAIGFTALYLIAKAAAAKKLSFDIKKIFIQKYNGTYQLFCKVEVNNRTKESITVDAVNLNFFYSNNKIGSIVYNTKTVFVANQKTEVAIPVKVDAKNILQLVKYWLLGNKINIDVKGTVTFAGLNLPIEKTLPIV